MTALLGVDYGTTSCKVQLFDGAGNALAEARIDLPVRHPRPGWVEQDSMAAWEAISTAIRAVLAEAGAHGGGVAAVAVTGTYNLTVTDKAGRPLRPAILYGDTRTPSPAEVQHVVETLGEARLAGALGLERLDDNLLTSLLRLLRTSKLLWLRAHEPQVFAQIEGCVASSADQVVRRLTGENACVADGLPIDDDLAALFDMPAWWFGARLQPGEDAGHVTAQAAAECGLAEGTPVVMTTTDSVCAMLGGGLTQAGQLLNLAGTTDVVALCVTQRPAREVGYLVRHVLPGLWLLSLSPLRGGALEWLRETLLPAGSTHADLHRLAANAPPGADGLLCLPFFSGEKGLVHDPHARGVLLGLTLHHGGAHIARAMLEGIAFGVRQIVEAYAAAGAPVDEARLAGGGARSRLWNQIKADVLNRPVQVLASPETGCLGAVMLAAAAVGVYASLPEAANRMARVAEVLAPDPQAVEVYQERYAAYTQLYPASREVFAALAA